MNATKWAKRRRNVTISLTRPSASSSSSSVYITPGAIVCVEAEVRGDVRIGTRTVVHPCAKILAMHGPIVIGDSNIVEELVVIENRSKETLHIGSNNVFEVRAHVAAAGIGDHNVFEAKCIVGPGVNIGNGCSFGAGTKVTASTTVPDNSVFFGDPLCHRIAGDRPPVQNLQIDFLNRVLPNYHHIKTPSAPIKLAVASASEQLIEP